MSKITHLLFISIILSACAGMPVSTPTPEPLGTPTNPPTRACSPPAEWSIRYNRSGGFAGFVESLTLDSEGNLEVQSERPPVDEQKTISEEQVEEITEFLIQACPFDVDPGKEVCADCFVYDLHIQMEDRSYAAQATDVTLTGDLQPLVAALSQLLQDMGE